MGETFGEDDREHWRQILIPAGEPWSGRARYAAAMRFHLAGAMEAEVLEIYRICSRLDDEDPLDALRAYRIGARWIEEVERRRAQAGRGSSESSTIAPGS
ncbi:hypothetical protein [Segnochrobactrum spirostomi]|uniref:Uncharacterized protein n=1 Tax=Segnochrobactrum spirostomi TaxID=2608987 RepID=A0A6A7Y3P2_9HYPH|nr:hypothetical protein [Segnochrobactrum spirostomi]MQT12379.1 hypothetical protein [Segnochrobactrum spirostomi]